MEKKLRRYTQEELQRAYPAAASEIVVGAKGTESNPYSKNEYEDLFDKGQWSGGYVEGEGYIPAATDTVLDEAVVTTSRPSGSGSGSGSDLFCNTHDKPYITEGSETFCSDCRRENSSYGSGSGSGGGLPVITGGGKDKGDTEKNSVISFEDNVPSKRKEEIKKFFTEQHIPEELIDFVKKNGLKFKYVPSLSVPAQYDGKDKCITFGQLFRPGDLYEEVLHYVQDQIGIESNEMIGHSNIEYQGKMTGYLLSELTEDPIYIYHPMFLESNAPISEYFKGIQKQGYVNITEFKEKMNETYPLFLEHYREGDYEFQKYSEHDGGPDWDWRWEDLLDTVGVTYK